MKCLLLAVIVLTLTGCAGTSQAPSIKANYIANPCLHAGDCTGRPFPSMRVATGEPWRSADEGLGTDSGSGL